MIRRWLPLIGLLISAQILSACSLYKSSVRRDFESQSLDRVTSAHLEECHVLSSLEGWWLREFPPEGTEILVARADLEVWRIALEDGNDLIRSFRPSTDGTVLCDRIHDPSSDLGEW